MSSTENMETKAGHSAALKVGGVRIPNRTRKNSEEPKPPVEEEDPEDQQVKIKEKPPQIVMWGQVRDQAKDYPSQAVQHMQHKPMPTHEPHVTKPVSARPNIIQQPRK